MYPLTGFGEMIADEVRMQAYAEALRRSVTPGCVVLDLGAGTGILTLLACQLGAGHVYAVEPSSVCQLIHAAARDNGFGDRVTVLECRSTEVSLPRRADVMVSDMRGVMPAFHTHLADIADARARLLAPGGRQIPERDRLFVAAISAEQPITDFRAIWQSSPFGLELGSALQYVQHVWTKHRPQPEAVLSEPVCWAELDYTTREDPQVRGEVTLEVVRAGTAHGLLLWFDAMLAEGVGFSNAPTAPPAVYGQAFYPWPEPLVLEPGDRLRVDLRADPQCSSYRWSWLTDYVPAPGSGRAPRRFRQSEFLSTPLSPYVLRKRAEEFTPELSRDGALTLHTLERMRAGGTLGAIAAELRHMAPDKFAQEGAALEFVADLSERLAR